MGKCVQAWESMCKQLHLSAERACWHCVPLSCAVLCGQKHQRDLAGQVGMLEELDKGFSRIGVQSFALEGILGELQVLTTQATLLPYNPCMGSRCTMQEDTVIYSP